MADFKTAYSNTMKIEGGYAHDKDDYGGETWKGISRKNWPLWDGWAIVDSFKNLYKPEASQHNFDGFESALYQSIPLQQKVLEFYKKNFWDILHLDEVANQAIAEEMFDTGVNMSTDRAAEFLQRALNATNRNQKDYSNISVDAKIGKATMTVLNQHPRPKQILILLNCQQGCRYMDITERNETQEKFMTSWLSRVAI